ncbi:hypothetical protein L6R53_01275 [Myxococcota bacterium]|nr:hypothetical protein [Myxococcota bacterium]
MLLALVAATLPVLLGLALAMAPGLRTAASGPWHRLVLALATAVVLLLMLPGAVQAAGWSALGVFAAAFAVPLATERLRGHGHGAGHGHVHPHDHGPGGGAAGGDGGEETHAMDMELGFAGLLLHQAVEGAELGTIFAVGGRGTAVALVLALHTVPLVAAVLHGCVLRLGVRGGLVRGLALVLATASGVLVGGLAGAHLDGVEPWVIAAVGGLLLHTLWHSWAAGR